MVRRVLFLCLFFLMNMARGQEKYTVVLPIDYDTAKSYPLFIVFHGGNSNMKSMSQWWMSKKLSNEFIVAYMEASSLDSQPNYWGWRNLPQERLNIKKYYDVILRQHNIDTSQVYVGGFSLGGKISIDLALNQKIPVKGVVSLNHGGSTTSFFTDKNVINAKVRRVSFVLISGENDMKYKKETEKIRWMLDKHNVKHKYISLKNLGHSVPNNFSALLDEYLNFIVHD